MRVLLTMTIFAAVCALPRMAGSKPLPRNQESAATSVTTGSAQGKVWLNWDRETRLGFVRGYLVGVRVGNRTGCSSYERLAGTRAATSLAEIPLSKCLANGPTFSKPPEEYANIITQFYRMYPKDVGLNLETLLWLLSDEQAKTPQQADAWFRGSRGSSEP
jgi:hypothetical protein